MSIQVSSADKGASALPVTADGVCKVLTGILGRAVTSKKAPPGPLTALRPRIVAVYGGDDDSVVSVWVCDLPFAAYAGAAVSLMPPQVAKECIAEKECGEDLLENLNEILNICRQCFPRAETHIAPPRLYAVPEEVPGPVAATVSSPKQRLDLEIAITGYGNGRLSIVA
jgi:hypothetical protein